MDRPYLPIPNPEPVDRRKRGGGGGGLTKPGARRQQQRLGDRFDRLETLMAEGRVGELVLDPASLAPERALVFEVAGGGLADFARQAQQIGLDYLTEDESAIPATEDFKVIQRKDGQDRVRDDKPVPVHFYLAMPDETALQTLVSLWRRYQRGEAFERGYAPWRDLFERLYDLRPWGPQDRVQLEDQAYFKVWMEENPDSPVLCEIEFWFTDSPELRGQRSTKVRNLIADAGGQILAESAIEDIRYHAILASLPGNVVEHIADLDDTVALLKADEVMFVRPQSVASIDETELDDLPGAEEVERPLPGDRPPLVAVLDGFPLQNHELLVGRIDIDDPDDLETRYASAESRTHGTSIASLILHGDMNRPSSPISRRIHIRPVLCCEAGGSQEHFPKDQLLVDCFYRAVTRLFEGEGDAEPTAPSVRVVNVSLGDESRPFARRMSPWARLLDFLSWRHKILFIVSTGNTSQQVLLPGYAGLGELENANSDDVEIAVLVALNEQRANRTLLSPSESVNSLTIGACHEDSLAGQAVLATQFDPFASAGLPSVISRIGLGYRGAIKPEVLVPGGRTLIRMVAAGDGIRVAPSRVPGRVSGMGAAAPDATGNLNRLVNMASISTSAALATRQAHLIMDALIDSGRVDEDEVFLPLYAKALLVHHAKMSDPVYRRMETIFECNQGWQAKKRDIARFLGFGSTEYDFEPSCRSNHAILVGHGVLRADQGHRFSIPAPEDLAGVQGWRAVTITVAWFTPINPRHQMYRLAKLEVNLPNALGARGDGVSQVDPDSRGKATVYHTRIEGQSITALQPGQEFDFLVDCMAQAGQLDDEIPYAIAASVEVGANLGIDIYTNVAQRLQVAVPGGGV